MPEIIDSSVNLSGMPTIAGVALGDSRIEDPVNNDLSKIEREVSDVVTLHLSSKPDLYKSEAIIVNSVADLQAAQDLRDKLFILEFLDPRKNSLSQKLATLGSITDEQIRFRCGEEKIIEISMKDLGRSKLKIAPIYDTKSDITKNIVDNILLRRKYPRPFDNQKDMEIINGVITRGLAKLDPSKHYVVLRLFNPRFPDDPFYVYNTRDINLDMDQQQILRSNHKVPISLVPGHLIIYELQTSEPKKITPIVEDYADKPVIFLGNQDEKTQRENFVQQYRNFRFWVRTGFHPNHQDRILKLKSFNPDRNFHLLDEKGETVVIAHDQPVIFRPVPKA